jgi:hypothetical protein
MLQEYLAALRQPAGQLGYGVQILTVESPDTEAGVLILQITKRLVRLTVLMELEECDGRVVIRRHRTEALTLANKSKFVPIPWLVNFMRQNADPLLAHMDAEALVRPPPLLIKTDDIPELPDWREQL